MIKNALEALEVLHFTTDKSLHTKVCAVVFAS